MGRYFSHKSVVETAGKDFSRHVEVKSEDRMRDFFQEGTQNLNNFGLLGKD